jgi:hypothetical protein
MVLQDISQIDPLPRHPVRNPRDLRNRLQGGAPAVAERDLAVMQIQEVWLAVVGQRQDAVPSTVAVPRLAKSPPRDWYKFSRHAPSGTPANNEDSGTPEGSDAL